MKRFLMFWLLATLAATVAAGPFGDDELLPVEEAFALDVGAVSDGRLPLNWHIADGYYLYRNKFQFSTDTPGVTLGEPVMPAGKIKHDEFFGEVETYRGDIRIDLPVTRDAGAPARMALKIVSQGCADLGVCYPPHTRVLKVELPPASPAASATGGALQALSRLGASFGLGGGEDELLPPDEAFRLNVEVVDARTLVARWQIAEGYYLYRDKFQFSAPADAPARLLPAVIPEGEHKNDEFFGDIQVFHLDAQATLPLQRTTGAPATLPLSVGYQGCAERGICYPPITKTVNLLLPAAATTGGPAAPPAPITGTGAEATHGLLSEQDAIARQLLQGNTLATLAAFFGFGLLLAFTPCVFPMIPILSSIIVGQGERISTRRGFALSSIYVLALALTYTAAGVFAGLFGENLQAAFQNPWILSAFAAVFVLLALSMFGFYDLQMPAFLQSRLTEISSRQRGGTYTGVAVMGFLSALIVGPCVAAPLAGALIYIGQTGDAVLGGLALFALSLGMGAPLIAIGTGAGKLLPKAGDWMNTIKAVFGVLLLAVAIWMLERILPAAVSLSLWAALLILTSVYLGALDHLPVEANGWRKFWKGTGLVSLVYGVMLLIGAASGASDPLQPLQRLTLGGPAAPTMQQAHLPFKTIKTVDDLDRELALARGQGRPVMLDFYADWCVSCKEMEKYTFSRPAVHQALAGAVLLQADVTANDAADKALLKRFNLIGPPSIIFFDAEGRERRDMRLVGFKKADDFVRHVAQLRGLSGVGG